MSLIAAEPDVNGLMNDALLAKQQNDYTRALALASKAVEAAPTDAKVYFLRGELYSDTHQPARAVTDFDKVLKLQPLSTLAFQRRGVEHFKLGHIKESIADFDAYLKAVPSSEPHHWQRGIAYYYAERYDDGRRQFELHQTVNPNDVENAVWHFLCVARKDGIDKARAALIPIEGDRRVPMKEVYNVFAGKAKPEAVLQAVKNGNPPPAEFNQRMFYANLYLGLYYEALRDAGQARDYIAKAAEQAASGGYMGAVARVHAQLFRAGRKY